MTTILPHSRKFWALGASALVFGLGAFWGQGVIFVDEGGLEKVAGHFRQTGSVKTSMFDIQALLAPIREELLAPIREELKNLRLQLGRTGCAANKMQHEEINKLSQSLKALEAKVSRIGIESQSLKDLETRVQREGIEEADSYHLHSADETARPKAKAAPNPAPLNAPTASPKAKEAPHPASLDVPAAPKKGCKNFPGPHFLSEATKCHDDTCHVEKMMRLDPGGAGKVFIDIGCNTGIDAVNWLEWWGSTPGIAQKWSRMLLQQGNNGVCEQNRKPRDANKVTNRSGGDPRVFCVEPMPANAKIVREGIESYISRPGAFQLVQAAGGGTNGKVEFPDMPKSAEGARIGVSADGKFPMIQVDLTTVDQLLLDYDIQSIDVLTVDTEGNDPAVLTNSPRALNLARYVSFEVQQYMQGTVWYNYRIVDIIDYLDSFGFDCFWSSAHGTLLRLTECWDSNSEAAAQKVGWSNIACVKRGDVWHSAFTQCEGDLLKAPR